MLNLCFCYSFKGKEYIFSATNLKLAYYLIRLLADQREQLKNSSCSTLLGL